MKARVLMVALWTVVAFVIGTPLASADAGGCPAGTTPQAGPAGTICIPAIDPGSSGADSAGAPGSGASPAGGLGCQFAGNIIPCSGPLGTWFSSQQCYAQILQPQPPQGEPEWDGHDPSEGSVYQCLRPGIATPWLYFFVANGQAPSVVDPADLAAEALGQMKLAIPDLQMAPAPPQPTYVGMDTWLWTDAADFQTLTQTVTAGATSVTVTATPTRSIWDLTDGSTTCRSAGRQWSPGMGDTQQTDCSYVFTHVSDSQPDDVFPVTATLTYQVGWSCGGACLATQGSLGEVDGLAGTAEIRVTERQSVVVQ